MSAYLEGLGFGVTVGLLLIELSLLTPVVGERLAYWFTNWERF